MSAFPPDFDPQNLPAAVVPVAKAGRAERNEPKRTTWWYVFEQWVKVPTNEDEFVLA